MPETMAKEDRFYLDCLEELATERHGSDEVNVDPLESLDEISEGNDGVWVRSWVFVPNDVLRRNGVQNPYDDEEEDE